LKPFCRHKKRLVACRRRSYVTPAVRSNFYDVSLNATLRNQVR